MASSIEAVLPVMVSMHRVMESRRASTLACSVRSDEDSWSGVTYADGELGWGNNGGPNGLLPNGLRFNDPMVDVEPAPTALLAWEMNSIVFAVSSRLDAVQRGDLSAIARRSASSARLSCVLLTVKVYVWVGFMFGGTEIEKTEFGLY
jgi:hypothetical protein